MINSLKGILTYLDPNFAVIDCGGVGFGCRITSMTAKQLPSVGAEAFLFTVMTVREDAIELFGFFSKLELSTFNNITTVKGVGPKVALGILSQLSPENVAVAIATGNHKALTKAPGVGPKLAQRLTLELKDKYKDLASSSQGIDLSDGGIGAGLSDNVGEAVRALATLGFSSSEATSALSKLDTESLSVEELVREGLRMLAKRG